MTAYPPEQAEAMTIEAFTHAGLVHYRDQYGQIGHHRPSDPKCPCNPKETKP